jgi:hypothetical protein
LISQSRGLGDVYKRQDDVLAVDEQRVTLPTLASKNYLKIGIYNAYKSMAAEAYGTQVVYFDGLTKSVK